MTNRIYQLPHSVTKADLEQVVCKILNQSNVKLLTWSIQSLSGGAAEHVGTGIGVNRIAGTARNDRDVLSWSVVVKGFRASDDDTQNEPSHWSYWKREMMAYQSGILDELPGNVIAAHCYRIQETDNGLIYLWLEDIQEARPIWTMEDYRLIARHLGQFNGAYLTRYRLPQYLWLFPWQVRRWLERHCASPDKLTEYSKLPLGRAIFTEKNIKRITNLWENRHTLLAKIDQLPDCFCHRDAFRRNLMLRVREDGTKETVALDWSMLGHGKLGAEVAVTLVGSLRFMEVDGRKAHELDTAVFEGYCAGLRDVGWQGDVAFVRFGYAAIAGLFIGIAGTCAWMEDLKEVGSDVVETIVGHPMNDIEEQWSQMHNILFDLGDEALALMQSI